MYFYSPCRSHANADLPRRGDSPAAEPPSGNSGDLCTVRKSFALMSDTSCFICTKVEEASLVGLHLLAAMGASGLRRADRGATVCSNFLRLPL